MPHHFSPEYYHPPAEDIPEAQSRIREFIDLRTANLNEIIASEYYVPRTLDTDRIARAANYILHSRMNPERNVRITDIGSGKATIDRLLIDSEEFGDKRPLITCIDSDETVTDKARVMYKDIPALNFVTGDIGNLTEQNTPQSQDIVLASWIHPERVNTYRNAIMRIFPLAIVEINALDIDKATADLGNLGAYTPVVEWNGPTTTNISARYYTSEHTMNRGDNIFRIHVRNDLLPVAEKLYEAVTTAHPTKKYSWEEELDMRAKLVYPRARHIANI